MQRRPDDGGALRIRACASADIDEILRIEDESFPDPYDRHTFEQLLAAEPGGFLVAEGDRGLLGYVTAACGSSKDAMIYSIAVSGTSRRSGVGRLLLEAELGYLSKKVARVYLQVSVNNPAAIALYEKFSFVVRRRLKGYYRNGDDALLMSLDLSASPLTRP
jgi:[ribosomal protein S18]-alanine N-acetyltransferase